MSENGRVIGISTPVIWRLRSSAMHLVQRAGFPGDCLYPACLKMSPPSPANGAAHSLQRGGDGSPRKTRRCWARPELSPVKHGADSFRRESLGRHFKREAWTVLVTRLEACRTSRRTSNCIVNPAVHCRPISGSRLIHCGMHRSGVQTLVPVMRMVVVASTAPALHICHRTGFT